LTTRGFGGDDFDRVAELIVDVLSNTAAAAAASGPSKAKYTLADGTAERVHAAASELLDANPLYPGLSL
jgi:glycine hydroxymethyltransferase